MSAEQPRDHLDLDQPRNYPQWLVWRSELKPTPKNPAKTTKVPYYAGNPRQFASSNNPETWAEQVDATKALRAFKDLDGIGFVFTDNDPFAGIDLDNCVEPDTGEIAPWAREWIETFDSYTEFSPSGTGIHIIVKGTAPQGYRKRNDEIGVELYVRGQYLTYTSRRVPGTPPEAREAQEELDRFRETFLPDRVVLETTPSTRPIGPSSEDPEVSNERILEVAFASKNGPEMKRLYHGDMNGYESQSSADQALANLLAFWVGPDEERINELFTDSALGQRSKWRRRPDYRTSTIAKALEGRTDFYDWSTSRRKSDANDASNLQRRPHKGDRYAESDASDANDATGGLEVVPIEKQRPKPQAPPPMRFPVHIFSETTRKMLEEAQAAIGCPVDLLAMPMLSCLSACIGMTRQVQLKRTWFENASLFLCVVAPPGAMKTPAANTMLAPLYTRHKKYQREFAQKKKIYEEELRAYEIVKRDARQAGETASAPPEPPTMQRTIASDTTIEALVALLQQNPRGILVYRDELAAWLGSFDQYKSGGKGSDKDHWLALHGSSPVLVDRKSNAQGDALFVESPFVTLFGGIQPRRLHLLGDTMEDGLSDRFLFAFPQAKYTKWSNHEISHEAQDGYNRLCNKLLDITMPNDVNGDPVAKTISLSTQAKNHFELYYNTLGAEIASKDFPPRLEAIWSKMRGQLARIALILHVTRTAFDTTPQELSVEDMDNAWSLIRYFQAHARRVHNVAESIGPLDILQEHIAILVEEREGEWKGTPSELYTYLSEEQNLSEDLIGPDPTRFSKIVKEMKDRHTSTLEIRAGSSKSKRIWRIRPKPSVVSVVSVASGLDKPISGATLDSPSVASVAFTPVELFCPHGKEQIDDCFHCLSAIEEGALTDESSAG